MRNIAVDAFEFLNSDHFDHSDLVFLAADMRGTLDNDTDFDHLTRLSADRLVAEILDHADHDDLFRICFADC